VLLLPPPLPLALLLQAGRQQRDSVQPQERSQQLQASRAEEDSQQRTVAQTCSRTVSL
jgi:hypothetical protein